MNLQQEMIMFCKERGHYPFDIDICGADMKGAEIQALQDKLSKKWGVEAKPVRIPETGKYYYDHSIVEVGSDHSLVTQKTLWRGWRPPTSFSGVTSMEHVETKLLVIPNSLAMVTRLPLDFPAWLEAKRISEAIGPVTTVANTSQGARL